MKSSKTFQRGKLAQILLASAILLPGISMAQLSVHSNLTSAKQVPDATHYINGGGELIEILQATISPNSRELYTNYASFPNVKGTPQAELFNINNGILKSSAQAQPDSFALGTSAAPGGTDAGQASNDFSLFSVLDDNGGPTLRVRVFKPGDLASANASHLLIINDFAAGSGSGNGGVFSADNQFVYFVYSNSVGTAMLSAWDLATGKNVTTEVGAGLFAEAVETVTVGTGKHAQDYVILASGTSASFTNPINSPPFTFSLWTFDRTTSKWKTVSTSPQFVGLPGSNHMTVLPDGRTIRIAVAGTDTLGKYDIVPAGAPFAAVTGIASSILTPADANDFNDLQIFDFNTVSNKLTKVYSANYNGMAAAAWVPSSNGSMLAIAQGISANINANTFANDSGAEAISWLRLPWIGAGSNEVHQDGLVVGPVQIVKSIFSLAISPQSDLMTVGGLMVTPNGAAAIPNFSVNPSTGGCFGSGSGCTALTGLLTGATIPQTGWNTLLLYSIDPHTNGF